VTQVAGAGPIVVNTVNVVATLPAPYSTELQNVLREQAAAQCDVQGGATRTPGFWQTHLAYACHIFEDHLGGTAYLGWKTVTSCEEMMGAFWAATAKESDSTKRDTLCQRKTIATFQLMAAILNNALDNGAALPIDPHSGLDIITAMQNALAGTDGQEINFLKNILDAYNNSGDDIAIVDNDGFQHGNATPRAARASADIPFLDCP